MIIVQGRATHHNMFIAFIDYINVSCRRIRSYNYLHSIPWILVHYCLPLLMRMATQTCSSFINYT